jgi:hypothetical protein
MAAGSARHNQLSMLVAVCEDWSFAMDDHPQPGQAFMSALVTEHFVLQSARSTTVSEAVGRSAVYLTCVSSALVAFGFFAAATHRWPDNGRNALSAPGRLGGPAVQRPRPVLCISAAPRLPSFGQ